MKKGFTLVEVTIVVIIMGIILSMTVLFGASYLKNLQLRTEKESLISAINYTLSYVKSTNYYQGEKFSSIEIGLLSTGVTINLDSGRGFGDQVVLTRSTLLLSGTSDTIHVFPYVRSCSDMVNDEEIVSFKMQSLTSSDSFCFDRDMNLCKLFVVTCP